MSLLLESKIYVLFILFSSVTANYTEDDVINAYSSKVRTLDDEKANFKLNLKYIAPINQIVTVPLNSKKLSVEKPMEVCLGLVVTSHALLTSADCLTSQNANNEWSWIQFVADSNIVPGKFTHPLKSEALIVHPDFKPKNVVEDNVGLIIMKKRQEVYLKGPDFNATSAALPNGTPCQAIGWGPTVPDVVIAANGDCSMSQDAKKFEKWICAKLKNDGSLDTLMLEMGSPLVCDGQVVGISTYRVFSKNEIYFYNLSFYWEWILKNEATTCPFPLTLSLNLILSQHFLSSLIS